MKFIICSTIVLFIISSCSIQYSTLNNEQLQQFNRKEATLGEMQFVEERYIRNESPVEKQPNPVQCKGKFQLTFPKDWEKWFYIDDSIDNVTIVYFYGFSRTSTILYEKLGCYGLPMFYILQGNMISTDSYDNIRLIGEINGVEMFYATSTGSDINVLFSISERIPGAIEVSETEYELVKLDLKKVRKMQNDIDNILDTFKPIE